MIVYCATSNPGKLREFRAAGSNRIIIHPLPGLNEIPPREETGSTFEENASDKAAYYSRCTDEYLFVDDSGLEVAALGGEPGVHSARYAGGNASDQANNELLLARMRGMEDRRARFVCAIALARGGEVLRVFRGAVEGVLLEAPHGANGFGYDPLFYYPPYGRSFGEIDPDRKLLVSHRGAALRDLVRFLERLARKQPR
ncbi:MAG TPA: RdgB/HAM1 family non-canonical purine NTP pyrophosphatase [Bryobacteraceae bacterium]|nr:RdgB/HAM1 family non-canonical purine NTP pyrophosphatase [Bryobacteraceae bacterium]